MKAKINKEEFLKWYNKGLNDTEISKKFQVCSATITIHRQKLGLEKNFKYKKSYDENQYIELYKKGFTDTEIGKLMNTNQRKFQDLRKELQLSTNIKEFNYIPNKFELGVLIGTLLGDGTLTTKKYRNVGGSFSHGPKQEMYCRQKQEILKNMSSKVKKYISKTPDKRNGNLYTNFTVTFKHNKFLTELESLLYTNRKKYINKKLLKSFNEASLAFLYMDDGFKASHGGYYIATDCFSKNDVELLQKFLYEKWKLKCNITKDNRIYILKESSQKFKNLIEQYFIEEMKYKLHVS